MDKPFSWLLSMAVLIDAVQQVHVDKLTRYGQLLVDYGARPVLSRERLTIIRCEFCRLSSLVPPYVLVEWRKVPASASGQFRSYASAPGFIGPFEFLEET